MSDIKKAISVLLCLLFALTILFPVGTLVCACFGYSFELISIFAFSAIISVISVFTVFKSKEKITNKRILILSYILTPLSFLNAVFYIFESSQLSVTVCVLVSVVCSFILTIRNIMSKVSKIIVSVLFSLMTAFIIFFAFMILFFGTIGQNTVVQTEESPDGKYYASIIDSDHGGLGGATIVDVYEKKEINALIFKIKKKPQCVYSGDWGEFKDMNIYWKDDDCLVVNSVEYEIEL